MGLFNDEPPKNWGTVDWMIFGFLIFFALYMIWQVVRAGRFW